MRIKGQLATRAEATLYDSSGNAISSELQTDGDYHLGVSMTQDVYADPNNASSVNLASGATWAGSPTSTLGVVGLQWNLNTDQNCTIYSEESEGSHTGVGTVATNGTTTLTGTSTTFERSFVVGDTISVAGETDRVVASITSDTELVVTAVFSTTASGLAFTHYHWDICYPFDFIAIAGRRGEGETVQATNAYWRLRVVNEGPLTTTYFRVSGVLCPIATPLPSSLSDDRRLKTESTLTGRENTDRHVWVSPTNTLTTNPQVRLVGHSFSGSTKDTNFWTTAVTNGGTVDQVPGEVKITTNTTADGTAKYFSKHRARFVAGHPNLFSTGVSFKTVLTADNIRRIGAYDGTEGVDGDGYYFELDYLTFSVGSRKAGTDTRVSTGSFNGSMGTIWVPTFNTYYKLDIEMTPMATYWYVDGVLLHKTIAGHQTGTITLPITMECNNDNSAIVDTEMHCIAAVIMREAELTTESVYYHLSGNSATHILKYGAGTLHKIMFNNTSGTTLTMYDNTAASGAVIGIITTASGAIGEWSYDLPFSNGLTLVTTGNSLDATIVYE